MRDIKELETLRPELRRSQLRRGVRSGHVVPELVPGAGINGVEAVVPGAYVNHAVGVTDADH